jgi:hypothetical protein
MLETLSKQHSLVSNFSTLRALLNTYGPPSLEEIREQSLKCFEAVGIPTHKDD